MITADQMIEIIKNRKIQILPVNLPNGSIGWVARTIDGSRAGPKHDPYSSPLDAVEAADQWFSASETRENDRRAERIIAALERGRYFIRSREIPSTDSEGKPNLIRVFSAFLPSGGATNVRDRPSFIQAVIDIEKEIVP